MEKHKETHELKGLIDLGWFGKLSEDESDNDDANREMGLPEGEDWGNK